MKKISGKPIEKDIVLNPEVLKIWIWEIEDLIKNYFEQDFGSKQAQKQSLRSLEWKPLF